MGEDSRTDLTGAGVAKRGGAGTQGCACREHIVDQEHAGRRGHRRTHPRRRSEPLAAAATDLPRPVHAAKRSGELQLEGAGDGRGDQLGRIEPAQAAAERRRRDRAGQPDSMTLQRPGRPLAAIHTNTGRPAACALAPDRISGKARHKVCLFPSMFSGSTRLLINCISSWQGSAVEAQQT